MLPSSSLPCASGQRCCNLSSNPALASPWRVRSSLACRSLLDEPASVGVVSVSSDLKLKTRDVAPPPKSVPVVHSAIYQRMRYSSGEEEAASEVEAAGAAAAAAAAVSTIGKAQQTEEAKEFRGNALQWALHKVDKSLDELEDNPTELQKEVYAISRSPIGRATSKGLDVAATVAVKGTEVAFKAALPVAKWAFKEGSKAAAGLLVQAMAKGASKGKEGADKKKE